MTKPNRRRPATIEDVAKKAGVSMMSVSRAIKGQSKVSEETRTRILKIAKEMKYVPNLSARRLAASSTIKVAVVFANTIGAYMGEFLIGVVDEATHAGLDLFLDKCSDSPTAIKASLQRLRANQVNGVVLSPPLCEDAHLLALLREEGILAVSIASGRALPNNSCVRIDEYKAAYEMTQYLFKLGHRRFGFVKGLGKLSASAERLRGFRAALKDASPNCSADIQIDQGDYTYRSGLEAGRRLLSAKNRPTAIFASNDDMAAGVLMTAHMKGILVPRDLSVAGFDDTPIASSVWPTLTTIRQPIALMAGSALKILVSSLHEDSSAATPVDELVKHALILRESTGTAPS